MFSSYYPFVIVLKRQTHVPSSLETGVAHLSCSDEKMHLAVSPVQVMESIDGNTAAREQGTDSAG